MSDIKEVLDFILNQADERDIVAVSEALRRRGERRQGIGGLDVQAMAKENSRKITEQMGLDKNKIRQMVRDFTVKIISDNAPELNPGDVEAILDSTVPGADSTEKEETKLPADVLRTMIRQFVSYSRNTMSANEQEKLHSEISDWYEKYWKMFPDSVQYILKDFIEEKITEEEYNLRLDEVLSRI